MTVREEPPGERVHACSCPCRWFTAQRNGGVGCEEVPPHTIKGAGKMHLSHGVPNEGGVPSRWGRAIREGYRLRIGEPARRMVPGYWAACWPMAPRYTVRGAGRGTISAVAARWTTEEVAAIIANTAAATQALALAVRGLAEAGMRAPCADPSHDLNLWTSDSAADRAQAIVLCSGCKITKQCHDAAIARRERHGVWAGVDHTVRQRAKRSKG